MAFALIDLLTEEFEPEEYKDDYREALMQVIEAKLEGQEIEEAPIARAGQGHRPDDGAQGERRGGEEEEGRRGRGRGSAAAAEAQGEQGPHRGQIEASQVIRTCPGFQVWPGFALPLGAGESLLPEQLRFDREASAM